MYAVFTRYDEETRQRAYEIFAAAEPSTSPKTAPGQWRIVPMPHRRSLLCCPLGVCEYVVRGEVGGFDDGFADAAQDNDAAEFKTRWDAGDVPDLAAAMGVSDGR